MTPYRQNPEQYTRIAARIAREDEWRAEHPPLDETIEGRTHLETADLLNDLIQGLRHWKQTKLMASRGDEYDESLSRWVDASELSWD